MERAHTEHSLESLLEHSDWIRSVARSMVRDPGTADDLAQEVWLKTMHQPPPADRPARAWFSVVAKNAAQQLLRGRKRQQYRERQTAKREASPTNAELAERIGLQQWVVESVRGLDEPYKRTVLLRFFEGLPPRKIAAEMNVPLETVKSRLQRALEILRQRMGSEHGPHSELGVMALMPLVGPEPQSVGLGVGVGLLGKKGIGLVAIGLACLTGVLLYRGLSSDNHPGLDPVENPAISGELTGSAPRGSGLASTELEIPMDVEAQARPVAVPAEEFVLVRTVAGEPAEPVPGAQVWIVTSMDMRDEIVGAGRGFSFDIESAAMEFGQAYRTNEEGEVRIPKPVGGEYAVSRSLDLFGCATLAQVREDGFELRLAVDRSLTIQTVDESGQPLSGIPVGIAVSSQGERSDLDWWAHTLGDRGQVTLHHVQYNMERHLAGSKVWSVMLATPTPNPTQVLIDPRALPDHPIQLLVQPGGRVVVQVADHTGARPSDAWVDLREVRPDRDSVGRDDRPMRFARYSKSGTAVFENVAPGIEVHVDSTMRGYRRVQRSFTSPGVGEEEVIEINFLERYPVVTAKVLDSQGKLLPKTNIEVRVYTSEDVDNGDSSKDTDEDGRLELSVRTRTSSDVVSRVELRTDPNDPGESLTAEVHITSPAIDGAYDLGEVRLQRATPVLKGRVIDSRGEPIYWAGIWVMRMNNTGDTSLGPYEWVHEWQTQSSEDGSFRLIGDLGPGDYRLRVARGGYIEPEMISFQPGDPDLEVILHQTGGLEGSLQLPEGVPANWLRISAQSSTGAWCDPIRPHADGEFFLRELPPGATAVKVYVPAWDQPLVQVPNVWVEGGEDRKESRLQKLDLSGALHRIDLKVVDRSGAPVPKGFVVFTSPNIGECHVAFQEGEASLLTPTSTINAKIVAPNYRPLALEGLGDESTVTLERGIPISVRLPDGFELPEAPFTLSLRLLPTELLGTESDTRLHADDGVDVGTWGPQNFGVVSNFDQTKEIQFAVGDPGSWTLSWVVRGERWASGLRSMPGRSRSIEILESTSMQRFELSPDAEDLEDSLASRKQPLAKERGE